MAQPLLLFAFMFRHLFGRRETREPILKMWWCVSCLEQIALDSHGRCSNCGSDAVDRILNFEAANRYSEGAQANRAIRSGHSSTV